MRSDGFSHARCQRLVHFAHRVVGDVKGTRCNRQTQHILDVLLTVSRDRKDRIAISVFGYRQPTGIRRQSVSTDRALREDFVNEVLLAGIFITVTLVNV